MTVSELKQQLQKWEDSGFGDLNIRIGQHTELIDGGIITYHDLDVWIDSFAHAGIFFIVEPKPVIKPKVQIHYT